MASHYASAEQTNLLSGQIAPDIEPDLESGRSGKARNNAASQSTSGQNGGQMATVQREQSIWEQSACASCACCRSLSLTDDVDIHIDILKPSGRALLSLLLPHDGHRDISSMWLL